MSDEKILDSGFNSDNKKDSFESGGGFESGENNSLEQGSESDIFSPEKEIQNEVSGAEKDSAYKDVLSKIKKSDESDGDDIKSDAEIILQKRMDAESNVKHLMELALNKGVGHAIKVARHMDDNFVLDMMHDELITDNFHRALVDKKMISEE